MTSHVEAMVKAVARVAQGFGVGVLSEPEKDIVVSWWARGVIDNGGFEYLCECERDITDVARRFRAIGLPGVASAIEAVADGVYLGAEPPADEQIRDEWLAKVDWSRFEPQLGAVYGVSFEEVLAAIERYVRDNPGAFRRAAEWARTPE